MYKAVIAVIGQVSDEWHFCGAKRHNCQCLHHTGSVPNKSSASRQNDPTVAVYLYD